MIRQALAKVVERQDLSDDEAEMVMHQIVGGEATPAQIAALLTALHMKGETAEEIAGCAVVMRRLATAVCPKRQPLVDVCGTGGDGTGTFNISTTVAFVVAGAGLAVAKHGNRSVSSRCGSADALQALGVNIDLSSEQVAACIDHLGLGFLFAPSLHPAMSHAVGPRREIGIPTIFNLLGPLCNPARASVQVIGVYSESLVEPVARVMARLGTRFTFVVHGAGGLDELSTVGLSKVATVRDGDMRVFHLHPREVGLRLATVADLAGGTPEHNAAIIRSVLAGDRGPCRDVVLLNSAAALVAAGLAPNFKAGCDLAAISIDRGQAQLKLQQLVEYSHRVVKGDS